MRHVHGGGLNDVAALLTVWTHGWALTRDAAPPVADRDALRIDVNQPDQLRRYVYVDPPGGLAERGRSIREPLIFLKAPMAADEMHALLDRRWDVERTGTFMAVNALAASARLPDGYSFREWREGQVTFVSVRSAGEEVARGRVVIVDGFAIHDRIATAPNHGRRGIATAVMAALGDIAREEGATRGLLTATDAGRALYEKLGWRALAPWTTAQLRS